MSLGARATSKGGAKGTGGKESKHNVQDKGKSAEKPQTKDKAKPQATTEQLRMANMIDRKTEEALDVRRMVLELMEMTCRTEEEVCSALHDSDNDMALACDLLLEENQRIQGEWQTSEKKKKKSTTVSSGNGDAEQPASINPRSRSGPRQRRDGGGGAGGEGGQRGRGSGRGRGSARGGRAGGRGPGRPRPGGPRPRPNTHHDPWPDSVDDNNAYGSSSVFPATEDWEVDDKYVVPSGSSFPAAEDWDNEEWSGSLSDSKVFTPSVQPQPAPEPEPHAALNNSLTEQWESSLSDSPSNNGPTSDAHLNYTYHNSSHLVSKSSEVVGRKLESVTPVSSVDLTHTVNQSQQQPIGLSGSLSAAQSQYLSQLTQQSQQQLDNSVYTSNYGVYGATELTSQRKPQRARVPPPSKIPSSAVEMPGGEPSQMSFIDVQFGALEPDALSDPVPAMHQTTPKQVSQAEASPPTHSSHDAVADANNYTSAASMLSESLSVAESTSSGATATADVAAASSSLESRLTASMKQLTTSEAGAAAEAAAATPATQPYATPYHHQQYTQRAKHQTVGQQQSMYATHHAVSHHPVYGANVYTPQVNSTNASLTGASAMTSAYPPSVTLSQYHTQPLNSYQQTSSSASVYGGSALYTAAAPYTAYQPTPSKLTSSKDVTYESSVSSQRPLSGSSTTQAAAAKVTTAAAKVTSGTNASAAQYAVQAQPQPQAFYTQQQGQAGAAAAYAAYAAEEAQMLRGSLPHHMVNNGGYYELGYGVSGVSGAREPATSFGLGAGERFGRADASSPQQVAPALPPGYFYYQAAPPPATYQTYGVFPYGGGGSSVTGVGGVSGAAGAKVASYSQQQPQYDTTQQQQDTYKQGGYSGGGKTGGAGGAGAEITSAMYAKAHATLNKVNSYEKAAFHSGTPPPFGGSAPHHLYIPAAPPAHHNPHHHHQQQHQMDVRVNSNHRRESSGGSTRGAGAGKPAGSKAYSQSYWAPN